MNVDNNSDSNLKQCTIQSKYFTSKSVLDDSLTDFQEKKAFNAPRKVDNAKIQPKKKIKRLRGQKDIRTALRPKKNELITYSNEFNKVCQQSGIDIDSEQLQLAIALSKSLQQSENTESTCSASSSSSSQERIGKIRTTLQEYGFTVPEIKYTTVKTKRLKYKKSYKLLLCSEIEKQQLICDRYSQILFCNTSKPILHSFKVDSNSELYDKATNVSYEVLRFNNNFYVEGLVQESVNTAGCLLKDWSEIPGRPSSPVLKVPSIDFESLALNQEELDIILSGSIKLSQEIMKKNISVHKESSLNEKQNFYETDVVNTRNEADNKENFKQNDTIIKYSENNNDRVVETKNLNVRQLSPTQYRSCSPDIFDDDDVSSTHHHLPSQSTHRDDKKELQNFTRQMNSNETIDLTGVNENSYQQTKLNNESMNLTECVNGRSQNNIPVIDCTVNEKSIYLSQGRCATKRKSDDFMDITECVGEATKHIRIDMVKKIYDIEETMDLIPSSNSEDDESSTVPSDQTIVKHDNNVQQDDISETSGENFVVTPLEEANKVNSNNNDVIFQEGQNDISLTGPVADEINRRTTIQDSGENIPIVSTYSEDTAHNYNSTDIELQELSKGDSSRGNDDIEDIFSSHSDDDIPLGTIPLKDKYSSETEDVVTILEPVIETVDLTQTGSPENICITNDSSIEPFKVKENSKQNSINEASHVTNNNRSVPTFESSVKVYKYPRKYISLPDKANLQTTSNDDNVVKYQITDDDHSLLSVNDNNCNIKVDTKVVEMMQCTSDINPLPTGDSTIILNDSRDKCSDISHRADKSNIKNEKIVSLDDSIQIVEDNLTTRVEKVNTRSSHADELNTSSISEYDIDTLPQTNQTVRKFFESYFEEISQPGDEYQPNICDVYVVDKRGNVSRKTEIDLTQSPVYKTPRGVSNRFQLSTSSPKTEINSHAFKIENLGKNGNISIDYDELFDNVAQSTNTYKSENSMTTVKHETSNAKDESHKRFYRILNNMKPEKVDLNRKPLINESMNDSFLPSIQLGGINTATDRPTTSVTSNRNDTTQPNSGVTGNTNANHNQFYKVVNQMTPNNKVHIKTENVTPRIDYASLTSPERNAELRKYGIKPLKRRKAIQLLTHIYNQTHPIVNSANDEVDENSDPSLESPRYPKRNRRTILELQPDSSTSSEEGKSYDLFAVTNPPIVQNLNSDGERRLYFENFVRANVPTCAVPLHIVFHNFVSSRRHLREAILRYEPIEIKQLRDLLRQNGYRYDMKDIVKFMDDKCITVKTPNTGNRNKALLK